MAKDGPVLFAETDELLMLDLVVLNGVVLLSLRRELKLRGLLLRKLHHHKALRDTVQLVFQENHAFKVDLSDENVQKQGWFLSSLQRQDCCRLKPKIKSLTEMDLLLLLRVIFVASRSPATVC